jgi:hypothetical protein
MVLVNHIRKVKYREIAKIPHGFHIAIFCGQFGRLKAPEVIEDTFRPKISSPSISRRMVDSFISRCAVRSNVTIYNVLSLCCRSKIGKSIIKWVSVDVIDNKTVPQSEDMVRQGNPTTNVSFIDRVNGSKNYKKVSRWNPFCEKAHSGNSIKLTIVNNSILSASERNMPTGFSFNEEDGSYFWGLSLFGFARTTAECTSLFRISAITNLRSFWVALAVLGVWASFFGILDLRLGYLFQQGAHRMPPLSAGWAALEIV